MRSDGPLQEDELNILGNLSTALALDPSLTGSILSVMDLLHAELQV